MKRITSLLLAFCLILGLAGCKKAAPWQEQYDLGIRYLSEGKYEEAVVAFTAAIEIDPKAAALYMGRAQAYSYYGAPGESLTYARSDFEKALELDETLTEAWLRLADVYIRRGEFGKAEEILREALNKAAEPDRIQAKLDEFANGIYEDIYGRSYRTDHYSDSGVLSWYAVYTYVEGEIPRTASITTYTAGGEQISHLDLTYDDQGRSTTSCGYDMDSGELSKTTYQYEDDDHWWEYHYHARGDLYFYIYKEKVSDGTFKRSHYSADGVLDGITVEESSADGKQYKCSYYDADGNLEWYHITEHDDEGNQIGSRDYNADGTPME